MMKGITKLGLAATAALTAALLLPVSGPNDAGIGVTPGFAADLNSNVGAGVNSGGAGVGVNGNAGVNSQGQDQTGKTSNGANANGNAASGTNNPAGSGGAGVNSQNRLGIQGGSSY